MRVLGIEVSDELLDKWVGWYAPEEQPYAVPVELAATLGLTDDRDRLTPELRDTFWLYDVDGSALVWLTQAEASRLPTTVRRAQPAPHRWPDDLAGREALTKYIEAGRRPSRHRDVAEDTWAACGGVLPDARRLAGTFPTKSGPNCFGAVMAASGVAGAEDVWMLREPFEDWLATSAGRGGNDQDPGTLLVWRSADGAVQHAAVTLGDGWALHKPSQGWMSPTKVLTVQDVKYSARTRGHRLGRYTLR